MLAAVFHGGWDTIIAAILFWLSPFVALFLLVSWLSRRLRIPGAIDTEATAVTPSGDIAGRYSKSDGVLHGFLLRQGLFSSIDFPGATLTDANWMNANGDIVGT